jgi:carboxyl-terminal processing protease
MHKHNLVWIAIFGVIALLFFRLPQMAAKQDAVVNTYSALVEVDALARQKYVEPIPGDRLVDGAIRGMLYQLDPYSGYIAPDQLAAFERRARGDFIGIGIEVGVRDERLTVIAPVEGSPAAAAGILPGDVILAINGQDLERVSVFDAEKLLEAPTGATVQLRVQHVGRSEPETLTVVCGPVNLHTVRGFRRDAEGNYMYMIDPVQGIGYMRISNFLRNTVRDVDAVLFDLERQGLRGLVLDLRFNPGGVLRQAIALVDRFVDDGVIVSTVTRRRAVQAYPATRQGTITDVKLVVLVNAASASAAEIVAGSLQALGRAVAVGERTFGKGSVQHLIHLTESGGAVKLTTAYYRLPDGRTIHRTRENAYTDSWGVIPNIEIVLSTEEHRAIRESRRMLDHAFVRLDAALQHQTNDTRTGGSAAHESPEIQRDRQLRKALELLRRPGSPQTFEREQPPGA